MNSIIGLFFNVCEVAAALCYSRHFIYKSIISFSIKWSPYFTIFRRMRLTRKLLTLLMKLLKNPMMFTIHKAPSHNLQQMELVLTVQSQRISKKTINQTLTKFQKTLMRTTPRNCQRTNKSEMNDAADTHVWEILKFHINWRSHLLF